MKSKLQLVFWGWALHQMKIQACILVRKLSIRKQKLNISGIFACQRKLLEHVHSKQAEERTSITQLQLQHFYSFLQLPAALQNLWSNAVSKSHLIYWRPLDTDHRRRVSVQSVWQYASQVCWRWQTFLDSVDTCEASLLCGCRCAS